MKKFKTPNSELEIENFEKSKEEIKKIYENLETIIKINPSLYIMPVELYNQIVNRLGHMEDRIRKQTASLMMHIKDKQELKRKLKEL